MQSQSNLSGNHTIVIFGASGDLTRRKLIPALFNLYCKGRLPENWRIVGVSRSAMTDHEFRHRILAGINEFAPSKFDAAEWESFKSKVFYRPGNLASVEDYLALDQWLSDEEKTREGDANRIYYLHVADNDSRENQHLAPGDGTIDWHGLFTCLKKHGFDGYVAVDVGRIPDVDEAYRKSIRFLKSIEREIGI